MKKILTIVGLIAAVFTTAGLVFKIHHLQGSAIEIVVGIGLFSFLFIPFYGYNLFYDLSGKRSKVISAIGAFALSVIALSVCFKMMHWPGANIMLVLGMALVSLIILPMLMIFKLSSAMSVLERIFHSSWYIAISLLFLGYLFKVQHWPASWVLSAAGVLLLSVCYFPLAVKF